MNCTERRKIPLSLCCHSKSVRSARCPPTGAVHQPDDRDAQAACQLFAVTHLVADGAVVRAATHGEVVATHHRRPTVDSSGASDKVGRDWRNELAERNGMVRSLRSQLCQGSRRRISHPDARSGRRACRYSAAIRAWRRDTSTASIRLVSGFVPSACTRLSSSW